MKEDAVSRRKEGKPATRPAVYVNIHGQERADE